MGLEVQWRGYLGRQHYARNKLRLVTSGVRHGGWLKLTNLAAPEASKRQQQYTSDSYAYSERLVAQTG